MINIHIVSCCSGGYSQCTQYNVSWEEVLVSGDTDQDSWPVVPCQDGWEYEMSGYHVSISVEQDWVCDQAWIPALSQSLFFCGAIPGMIFFGWFADIYGRIPATIFSNVVALILGVATPFCTGHISFLTLRFLMGTAFNTFYTIPYILGDK